MFLFLFCYFFASFFGLLSFSGSLVTKHVSLDNESFMASYILIYLNPIGLNYHLFMVSL